LLVSLNAEAVQKTCAALKNGRQRRLERENGGGSIRHCRPNHGRAEKPPENQMPRSVLRALQFRKRGICHGRSAGAEVRILRYCEFGRQVRLRAGEFSHFSWTSADDPKRAADWIIWSKYPILFAFS
jgi:hypothetical protein